MRFIAIIIILCSVVYAHTEDIFPDQYAIVKRIQYADTLENNLQINYKQATVSLFGLEEEHILIISPHCAAIKNYLLTGAWQLGIMSARCRWYDGQYQLRIPK